MNANDRSGDETWMLLEKLNSHVETLSREEVETELADHLKLLSSPVGPPGPVGSSGSTAGLPRVLTGAAALLAEVDDLRRLLEIHQRAHSRYQRRLNRLEMRFQIFLSIAVPVLLVTLIVSVDAVLG